MKKNKGQALLEYVLMVLMLAVTFAVIIRGVNRTTYGLWTGLVRQVSSGCVDCNTPPGPDF